MRLVRQGDTSFRIQDVCLALLQDILLNLTRLAGAYGNRWPCLNYDAGVDVNELQSQFVNAPRPPIDPVKNYFSRFKKCRDF